MNRQYRTVSSSGAIYPKSHPGWFIGILIFSKFLKSVGIYLSYDLLSSLHVVEYLAYTKLIAAIFIVLLQKPFSRGSRLSRTDLIRVFRFSALASLCPLLVVYSLTLCGPLRTLMLSHHHEVVTIAAISALFKGTGGHGKFRGGFYMFLGVALLLLVDNDVLAFKDHPEGGSHTQLTHVFFWFFSSLGISDHKGGVILLLVSLFFQAGVTVLARPLAAGIGGSKRLAALCTLMQAGMLLPIALLLRIFYQLPQYYSHFIVLLTLIFAALSIFVVDFYVEELCVQRLESLRCARVGGTASLVAAILLTALWKPTIYQHYISPGALFAAVCFLAGNLNLTSPLENRGGTLIGYSPSGLPLYNYAGDAIHRTSHTILRTAKAGLQQILEEKNSRNIFYFLCINLAFCFVEFVYGVLTNSLGLITDAFHMLFDCSALVLGLYAAIISRWKPSKSFPFGYGRVEVVSGYVNGLFLVVISVYVLLEALSRLFNPPQIDSERLLPVSVAGLVVNIIGIFSFRHGHSHGHNHSHGHSHSHNTNMEGLFLHVLADTLGSIGVIISSLLISNYGWIHADAVCSLLIAGLIFSSVVPLLKESGSILLLRSPEHILKDFPQKLLAVDGVTGYESLHVWQHSTNVLAATVHVQTKQDTAEQRIIQQVTSLLKESGVSFTTVQVEKPDFLSQKSRITINVL